MRDEIADSFIEDSLPRVDVEFVSSTGARVRRTSHGLGVSVENHRGKLSVVYRGTSTDARRLLLAASEAIRQQVESIT